jgi:hypothetical protein
MHPPHNSREHYQKMYTLSILLEEIPATLVAHAMLNLGNGHLNGLDEEDHKKTR